MSKMKLKIGEFSQMMQVTVKTLSHYELKKAEKLAFSALEVLKCS